MMPKTKDLLAGYGWQINAKNIAGYKGFKDSHVVLTANQLEYPWTAPRSSGAGFRDGTAWAMDVAAIACRCTSVYFSQTHDQNKVRFPFTVEEFA